MKRRASTDGTKGSRKRSKASPSKPYPSGVELFDFPEHQRYITSILSDQNLDRKPGYIVGNIFMKYSESEKKIRFVMSTEQSEVGSTTVRIQIVFGKQCSKLLRRRGLRLPLSHGILLSLRGCTIANSGASANGAIATLEFTEKVLLKILSPGQDNVVVDLWGPVSLRPSQSPDSGWYNPPVERPLEEPAPATEAIKSRKKEKHLLRSKEHFEKRAASNISTDATGSGTKSSRSKLASPKPTHPQGEQAPAEKVDGPLGLKAGCRTADTLYTPLSSATRISSFYNVVGVVYSNSNHITQSHIGGKYLLHSRQGCLSNLNVTDYMCTLLLVDPDNRVRSGNSHLIEQPTKVICFARMNSKWLPTVREGDIVVLHNVKASSFQGGSNLVGYNDKLQWAIYGLDSRLTHGVIPSDVPRETTTDRGFRFSPFLQREDPVLLDYCSKLRLWWNAVERQKEEFLGKTHQVGSQVLTPPPERSARPWLPIKDATPNTVSNGYFNCVAQVIHKHRPDQGCYALYVTDYTSNDQCPTYDGAEWCPPGLAKAILKIELWDQSASFGPQMEVGEFFSFRNLRMRVANNGYYEAKMKELKIAKLNPDDSDSTHTVLKGLLERKAKWATKHKIEERLEKLEYTKIQDVEMRVRFNCIVEILLVNILDGSGSARVYVTDYTANDLLPEPDIDADDFDGLEKRVFKLVLRDSQAQTAKSLEPGTVCVFQKVMMKLLNKENVGDLGGEQPLIKRLYPGLPSHKALMEDFENRKKIFFGASKAALQQSKAPSVSASIHKPQVPEPSENSSPTRSNPRLCTSIKQLQSRIGPVTLFGIRARVKWAKPRQLWDYCRPYCAKCYKRIPSTQKACVACDDFDHEFITYQYNFNISIEDEEGSEMPIAVLDEALFLTDLPRVNMARDPSALEEFRTCFERIAGNVLEYQDDRCMGKEDTELKTPLVCLYGCRYEEEGRKICQLLSYTLIES
ncbi:hypothetical protein F5890DRAFT_1559161 [Lentinula detonsa]|uniref:Protection of telomeres protein 1 n=1 Tax=Lentinula detonsa TaxID=2804962 RepID=A0AA38PNX9_9AGAR|nr:hypothetical protein F5890DRAFT_1559161 [Lentinula detonsa]